MLVEPAPNTITRPYRGLSVQHVDIPLTSRDIEAYLLGREVYRRTEYLVLRRGDAAALVQVAKENSVDLFAPVTEVLVLAEPGELVWVDSPDTDAGNATALAHAVTPYLTPSARAYVVRGRYEHVNFIWTPTPLQVRVTEVVPPDPPKLLAMAQQAVAFDEDLPPIDLVADTVDIGELANDNPASCYLLPCRGSGAQLPKPVEFLDTRPKDRRDWLLIGCERSVQFHRRFYGDEPSRVDICPRRRADVDQGRPTLTKCCLLERGVDYDRNTAVVPWGANLDEVREALRWLSGLPPVGATP
ncbi:DUF7714 family protein [Amycolatopsis benzoatilytica]|uniref:DUF7714 family protein n=1 Tax=Amycolatopsis benzoatilytica TaxID=346045 RepID=UPI0003740A1D|nr:hypothetical protein [Amycolatopsis benzoatilytica]